MIRRFLTAGFVVAVLGAGVGLILVTPANASTGHRATVHQVAVHRQTSCTPDSGEYSWVTVGGVNYYLGTPNNVVSGTAAVLKPAENGTSLWVHCNSTVNPGQLLLLNRGLALTSRDTAGGATVTVETPGNSGNGYSSQLWTYVGGNPYTFQNVKTGLYLRVPNGGPIMYQTVTTGKSATNWNQS